MTRPASRIDSVLAALAAYWRAHPDLRLGQLVLNALRDPLGAVNQNFAWNAEDDVLVRGLERMTAAAEGTTGGCLACLEPVPIVDGVAAPHRGPRGSAYESRCAGTGHPPLSVHRNARP